MGTFKESANDFFSEMFGSMGLGEKKKKYYGGKSNKTVNKILFGDKKDFYR